MESSFTDVEKRFVLAEMIKASELNVDVLVGFIKSHGVLPNWMQMQLPNGRNMIQCHRATEIMLDVSIPPPRFSPPTFSPLKRKSFSEAADHPSKKQALASPGDASPYGPQRNLSTQSPSAAHPVNIKPRPNGFPLANPPANTQTPISQNIVLPPRRRGRPPKAETLARQGLAQPAQYQAITPAPPAPSPIAPRPQSPAQAYQVWSSTAQDAKTKKKGRQSGEEKQLSPPEMVPRTLHPSHNTEPEPRQDLRPSSSGQRSSGEHLDWRETVSGPSYPQGHLGAPRREPQLPPIQTLPPPRSPQPPLERGPHPREPPPTTAELDHTRQGGHAGTVN